MSLWFFFAKNWDISQSVRCWWLLYWNVSLFMATTTKLQKTNLERRKRRYTKKVRGSKIVQKTFFFLTGGAISFLLTYTYYMPFAMVSISDLIILKLWRALFLFHNKFFSQVILSCKSICRLGKQNFSQILYNIPLFYNLQLQSKHIFEPLQNWYINCLGYLFI